MSVSCLHLICSLLTNPALCWMSPVITSLSPSHHLSLAADSNYRDEGKAGVSSRLFISLFYKIDVKAMDQHLRVLPAPDTSNQRGLNEKWLNLGRMSRWLCCFSGLLWHNAEHDGWRPRETHRVYVCVHLSAETHKNVQKCDLLQAEHSFIKQVAIWRGELENRLHSST